MIHFHNVSIQCGERTLLQPFSLTIERGAWHSLIGESGSGKSLTALALSRLLPSTMTVAGTIDAPSDVLYLFQNYHGTFAPFMTIGAQCALSLHFMPKAERKARLIAAFNELGLDGPRVWSSYPQQLSGGQIQRASLALALIVRPQLIIADEPTTALDLPSAITVLDQLRFLQQQYGCTILFITHDLAYARRYSERLSVLHNGRFIETGTFAELETSTHDYTQQLFASLLHIRGIIDDHEHRHRSSSDETIRHESCAERR